jgi:hypothetical protein
MPINRWESRRDVIWHLNEQPRVFLASGAWDPPTLKRATHDNETGEWCSLDDYRRGDIIIHEDSKSWLLLSGDSAVEYLVRCDLRPREDGHALFEALTSRRPSVSFAMTRTILWALDLTFRRTFTSGPMFKWLALVEPENNLEGWLPACSERFPRRNWSVEIRIAKTSACTHAGACRNPLPHYVMNLMVLFDPERTGLSGPHNPLYNRTHRLYSGTIDGLTPLLDFSQLEKEKRHARKVAFDDYRFVTRPNCVEIEAAVRGRRYLPETALQSDWHWPHYVLTQIAPLLFDAGLFVFPTLWVVNHLRGMSHWSEHLKWETLEAVYQSRRRVREARALNGVSNKKK